MRKSINLSVLALSLLAVVGCERAEGSADGQTAAVAQSPAAAEKSSATAVVIKEEKPGLFARAAVSSQKAQEVALAKVPGTIKGGELEEEDGKLIYSFDIKVEGQEGITEVHVDAQTGAILKVEHEDDDEDEDNEVEEAKEKPGK